MINTILGILFFLIAITIIVVVHEWGHLVVAKRNGVKCFEFSIGMGPKLFTFHTDKTGTVYNVRAIPLGGYVMMAGEEEASDIKFNEDESLMNKKPWQKIKILFAGAIMNFILGWFVLFIAFFFFGVSSPVDSNLVNVQENSPAAKAGLVTGDTITEIDGKQVTNYEDIQAQLVDKDQVEVTYEHNGVQNSATIIKQQVDCSTSLIGISPEMEMVKYKPLASITTASSAFANVIKSIGQSLQMLFSGTAGISDLMGPVGIATASKSVVTQGISIMLMTIAFLSINIGMVNILPFPALDGGRIILALIELVTKRRVPEKVELYLNFAGFILLMGLFVVVTFSDIGRLGTAEYYQMGIESDSVCARDAEEISYTFDFTPLDDSLPQLVSVDLSVSDGVITSVTDGDDSFTNDSATVEFEYSEPEAVPDFSDGPISITVKPDSNETAPLDLTVKVYDEKGDTINQAIYRIER